MNPLQILICVFVLFTAFPIHEFAHAAMAVHLGDDTPIRQGRYTLSPFAHLSVLGSLALVFLGFGWAKPVQTNPGNFKNPRRDMVLVALMGPLSHIIMALFALAAMKLMAGAAVPRSSQAMYLLHTAFLYMIQINLTLAVFNLLPVPPLDGSKVLNMLLPYPAYAFIRRYEGIITVLLLLALYTGYLFVPLQWMSGWIFEGLNWVTRPIDLLFA